MPGPSRSNPLNDTDQLEQLVVRFGWQVDLFQPAPGPIKVHAAETWIRELLFFRECYECPVLAHGIAPPDAFEMMLRSTGSLRLFGEEISSTRVGLLPPSSRIDAIGLAGLETHHIQVGRERLEPQAIQQKCRSLE